MKIKTKKNPEAWRAVVPVYLVFMKVSGAIPDREFTKKLKEYWKEIREGERDHGRKIC